MESQILGPNARHTDMHRVGRPDQGSDPQATVNLNSQGNDSCGTSRAVYRPMRPQSTAMPRYPLGCAFDGARDSESRSFRRATRAPGGGKAGKVSIYGQRELENRRFTGKIHKVISYGRPVSSLFCNVWRDSVGKRGVKMTPDRVTVWTSWSS
jgi:hypothetical protein